MRKIQLKLSYRLNFINDSSAWFNVENYVKFLTDRFRSIYRSTVKNYSVEEFYKNAYQIIKKTILGDDLSTGYFFKEKNLFKIQLGDFLYRNDADLRLMDLRSHGYPAAWVVKTMINIPVGSATTSNIQADSTQVISQDAKFKIQVLVTSSIEKAENVVEQLKAQFKQESYFIKSGTFYKIYLGRFGAREQAEKTLSQVKTAGYSDAWLVY